MVKKPPGKADPGWYESPTEEGYFQYWDGDSWNKSRVIDEGIDPKSMPPQPDLVLGKFLLTKPYHKDGAIILMFCLNVVGWLNVIYQNYFPFTGLGPAGLFALLIDVFMIVPAMILFWISFLINLIPRRYHHNRKLAKLKSFHQ